MNYPTNEEITQNKRQRKKSEKKKKLKNRKYDDLTMAKTEKQHSEWWIPRKKYTKI